jgi:hypothetical protein
MAQPAAAQVYVRVGPPAPIVERRPPPPARDDAWHNGYWRWNGSRYVWAHGYYVHHPYGAHAWVPGHWVHLRDGRWVFRDGHWA